MTASEAIERIDEVLESDYNFDETLGYQLTSDDFEWLEEAKNALEKQIPKKAAPHKVEAPKISFGKTKWCKGTTIYKCPCCGTFISYCNYCNKCGQKLLRESDTE